MLKGKFTQKWKLCHYLFTLTLFKIYSFEKCPSIFVCLFWKSMVINTVCLPSFLKIYFYVLQKNDKRLEQHRDE